MKAFTPLIILFSFSHLTLQCIKGINKYSLATVILLLSTIAPAAHAAEHGGDGIMTGYSCFKPSSKIITNVCADYKISWKLWTLMGEPVGDYNLKWTLLSLIVSGGSYDKTATYYAQSVPPEIAEEVKKIELYFDGKAYVSMGTAILGYHSFNTGVATPAGETSMNTPGSPKWSEMFTTQLGVFLTDNQAKQIFRNSDTQTRPLQLNGFSAIKQSVFNLSDLEYKIAKLCEKKGADKQYPFCPEQKPEEKKAVEAHAIEDAFAKMEKQTGKTPISKSGNINDKFAQVESYRAEQERLSIAAYKAQQEREARQIRHDEAVQFCAEAVKSEKSCIESACNREPSKTTCTKSRRDSSSESNCPEGHSCISFPTFSCASTGPNPKYSEWESCTRNMGNKCNRSGTPFSSVDECVRQRDARDRNEVPLELVALLM